MCGVFDRDFSFCSRAAALATARRLRGVRALQAAPGRVLRAAGQVSGGGDTVVAR